jgi:ABC-type oligopeptide transport system substrate-binding subunit
MFNAFQLGQLDITDLPINPASLPITNPDFFVTSPSSAFTIFELDINNHAPFLGVAQEVSRTTSPPGIIGAPTATPGCQTGIGSLIVNLVNMEENNSPVKDPLNKIIAKGPQTFTISDLGGSSPNGTYVFPCSSAGMLAGTYTISTSVYSGTATIFVGSGQIITVTLGVNYNSPSTLKPTIASVEIRRALAHLLDKPNFVQNDSNLRGRATCNDIYASPAQGLGFGSCRPAFDGISSLPQSIIDDDLAEHSWAATVGITHEVSAYNLQADTIGSTQYWWATPGVSAGASVGYSGLADLRAACDHFVKAGFAITPSGATCSDVANASVGTTTKPGYPHLVTTAQEIMYIRTHAPRKAFGQIIADSLNFLFGTANNGATLGAAPTNVACAVNYGFKSAAPGCTSQYYTITDVAAITFGVDGGVTTWNIYTGGGGLNSDPDTFYTIFHSQFASNICGGVLANFPSNFMLHCDPAYDTQAAAGEFSSSLGESDSFFSTAAIIGHRTVMNIPVYSPIVNFLALNGWNFQDTNTPTKSSLVNGAANGILASSPGAYWSILNMRQKPGSQTICTSPGVPSGCTTNRNYLPGGGNPSLIRDSLSQDTDFLNPFQATTIWDFEIINKIFDTLLQINPITAGGNSQAIDWMTTGHTSSFNPNEQSCLPNGACTVGTTTQLWHLRNDLSFHDGSKVTADDVAFSLIAARDVPAAIFQSNVANVASAVAVDSSTIQVKLMHQSPFYTLAIGSIPILPKHIWGPLCTGTDGKIGGLNNQCASFTFDPMAAGAMVGSGPWLCQNLSTGVIGGSCSQNANGTLGGQVVTVGGKIVLHQFRSYMRCCSDSVNTSLGRFSWADRNNDGIVSILDMADVAFHFGQPDPYWNTGQNPLAPNVGTDPNVVDIGEVATVAAYFGHGLTNPLSPSQLVGLDPCINPFFQSSPPC